MSSLAKSEMGFKSSDLCISILTLPDNLRVPPVVTNGVIYNCAACGAAWVSNFGL